MVNIGVSVTGLTHGLAANLRNGVPANIRPPSRASAIDPMYNWVNVADGTGREAVACIGGWIATAYGCIGAGTINVPELDAAGAATNLAAATPRTPGFASQTTAGPRTQGTIADWTQFTDAAAADPSIRRRAIALGSARAAISAAYALGVADFLPNEINAATIWTAVDENGNPPDSETGYPATTIRLTSNHSDARGNLTFEEALGDQMADLSEIEWNLSFAFYRMALAAPPLAGVSLLDSNHHFLSNKLNSVMSVEGQVLSEEGSEVMALYRDNIDVHRDMLWHKASHPLTTELLRLLALDDAMSARFDEVGLGSAAIRVPYVEPVLRAARAYLAMHRSVVAWINSNGHNVRMPGLDAAVAAVEAMPRAGAVAPYANTTPMTRDEFIRTELTRRCINAKPVVAWCIGAARANAEQTGERYSSLTAGRAYSVRKIEQEDPGSVGLGRSDYEDTRRYARNQAERGRFTPKTLSDITP